jgi:hypothetical protein
MSVIGRPVGVSIIAVIWLIGGLFNIYSGLDSLVTSADLSAYQYGGWYNYGIPVLLAISVIVMIVGLLQLVGVAGLWSGKKYAYRIALLIPLLSIITNLSSIAVSLSASFDIALVVSSGITGIGAAVFWLIIYLAYFNKQHVKIWLKVIPAPAPQPYYGHVQYPATPPVFQQKHFCKHCGAETPNAAFCGNCGRQLN